MENTNSASMSEPSSLLSIFFEPGRTFEWLRDKPKFIMAGIVIIVATMAYQMVFLQQMGPDRMRRFMSEQLEKNPQIASMPAADKEKLIEQQLSIQKVVGYALPIFVIIGFLIGTLLYWLGAKAMGGSNFGFLQALSVFVYSSFPPTLIAMLANILILFLKSPDDIDIATSSRGLLHANPTMFYEGKETPVLTTLISTLDLFSIWGWILAAIGLSVVARLSKGSAWGVVIIIALIGVTLRVVGALLSGNPS